MANAGNILGGIGTGLTGIANSMNMYDETKKRREELALQKEQMEQQKTKFKQQQHEIGMSSVIDFGNRVAQQAIDDPNSVASFTRSLYPKYSKQFKLTGVDGMINDALITQDPEQMKMYGAAMARFKTHIGDKAKEAWAKNEVFQIKPEHEQYINSMKAWMGDEFGNSLSGLFAQRNAAVLAYQKEKASIRGVNASAHVAETNVNEVNKTNATIKKETGGRFENEGGLKAIAPTSEIQTTQTTGPDGKPLVTTENKPDKALLTENKLFASKLEYGDKFVKPLLDSRLEARKALGLLQSGKESGSRVVPAIELLLASSFNGGRPTDIDAERMQQNPSFYNTLSRYWDGKVLNKDLAKDQKAMGILLKGIEEWSDKNLTDSVMNYSQSLSTSGIDPDVMNEKLLQRYGLRGGNTVEINAEQASKIKGEASTYVQQLNEKTKRKNPQQPQE